MNVTVIAPHPDDEAIGCGGAICLHVERGNRVTVVFLTSGELGLKHLPREEAWRIREREAEAAAAVLGVSELTFLRQPDWGVGTTAQQADALRPVLLRQAPGIVYLPHPQESHRDHEAVLPVVRSSLEGGALQAPLLLTYEVWTPLVEYSRVEDITAVMSRKLRAVRCYPSQMAYCRYDRAVRGLGLYRGALAGRCSYAEVFREISSDVTGGQR
jgi:N-acetylglucosamine malate deacetylase 1